MILRPVRPEPLRLWSAVILEARKAVTLRPVRLEPLRLWLAIISWAS